MIFQRTTIAERLFHEEDGERIKLVNQIVELLKREGIGKLEKKQSISFTDNELSILNKIVKFCLFFAEKECSHIRTTPETEALIRYLLKSIEKNKPLLIFALFCPSYKKGKNVFGFNIEIGDTTKKGINNLLVLSQKATELGIKNEALAIYSDLVLENYDKLTKTDFLDLEANFKNFVEYSKKISPEITFLKISQVGRCKQRIGIKGFEGNRTDLSDNTIQSIVYRSMPFYKGILDWEDEPIELRTRVLASSCSIMGDEIRKKNPNLIMVMTENIYERAVFYYANNLSKPIPIFYPHKTETKIDKITIE